MLTVALVLFGLAALLGLTLAVAIFRQRETTKPVAVIHGLVGASGLVFLVIHALSHPHKSLTLAIILLVIAALGGVLLFANDLRKKPGPLFLVAIHALAAIAAVLLVATVAFG